MQAFQIIQSAVAKGYDKFNIVIRRDGVEVGQVTVAFTSEPGDKTVKLYQIYVTAPGADDVEKRRNVATWYKLASDVFQQQKEIESEFDCRVMIDDCWGFGPELYDFHRYIRTNRFSLGAVDDLIRSYKTYKNGAFIGYLEAVKAAIEPQNSQNITYSLLSTSGRPSLERAYKSFRL